MIHTYFTLGVMGTVLIGAILLEKYLVQNDYVLAAKLLSDGIHYGVRWGSGIHRLCIYSNRNHRRLIMEIIKEWLYKKSKTSND